MKYEEFQKSGFYFSACWPNNLFTLMLQDKQESNLLKSCDCAVNFDIKHLGNMLFASTFFKNREGPQRSAVTRIMLHIRSEESMILAQPKSLREMKQNDEGLAEVITTTSKVHKIKLTFTFSLLAQQDLLSQLCHFAL